ncbi:PTS sugar transporter subunit IIA [Thalassorhabdomicrobium marinisediminis]|uniref:PTS lactose transporter subunit IIC n=1 Tax=Thalassorhabdomicrobium marinisediminis TaxID=2170577 RepID=A0A2T7G005_9RHOB|nr:PTS sugar transporter subunit IIA [Thalassorhabdomicrobium marinisediminis]PVA07718.1 PTS lactose transporter subunit IIC [Thalassorhabdomicrobium marinisediminis]
MTIHDILPPTGIKVIAAASSKKRLLHDIGDMAQACFGLDQSDVVEALLERESLGPTGVGQGVALPHARLPNLKRVCGVFVRVRKPLDFDSVDRQPVDLAFALFAPEDAGVEHLKALALVSRTLRDEGVCNKLRSNEDPSTIYTILTEATSAQAA